MALQSITVTFPKALKPKLVKNLIEGNMKANSKYRCRVQFKEFDGEENVYLIWANEKEAFFYIGMTAAEILSHYI